MNITVKELPRLNTARCFEVTIPVSYLVITSDQDEPIEVSRDGRVLWGQNSWNKRGRYLGHNKSREVRDVCDAVRRQTTSTGISPGKS